MTRTEVAKDLARWHFIAEPEIMKIFWIEAPGRESDPLRFLELATRRYGVDGGIEIFGFDATKDVPYPSEVALITELELSLVASGVLSLPAGWALDKQVHVFTREELEVPVEAAEAQ